jgi:hypothetical protein
MVKVSPPVSTPPVLLTVTVTAALVSVTAVSSNVRFAGSAWSAGAPAAVPTKVAVSLSTTLLTVALTVRVALNAPAVSSAGTSSRTARFTQLLGAIVAFDTWSSVTAKSFASVPAMPKFAFVASNVALLLHTVRVISVPAVPIPAVPKVTCDGVMEIGPPAEPWTVAESVAVVSAPVAVTVPVFLAVALVCGVNDTTTVQ